MSQRRDSWSPLEYFWRMVDGGRTDGLRGKQKAVLSSAVTPSFLGQTLFPRWFAVFLQNAAGWEVGELDRVASFSTTRYHFSPADLPCWGWRAWNEAKTVRPLVNKGFS